MFYVYQHVQYFLHSGLNNFLIVADLTEIYIVSLDVPGRVDVPMDVYGTRVVSAVTWDSRTDTIYFADKQRHTISSISITVGFSILMFVHAVCN